MKEHFCPAEQSTITYQGECSWCGEREALAQTQEPVGHRDGYWCADLTCKKCYSADFRFKHKNSVDKESLTTPPQRTWVGLTDEDQFNLVHAMNENDWDAVKLLEAAEAKLKEKNT